MTEGTKVPMEAARAIIERAYREYQLMCAASKVSEIQRFVMSETGTPMATVEAALKVIEDYRDALAKTGQWSAETAANECAYRVRMFLKNAAPQARGKTVDSQESAAGEPGKPAEMAATPNTANVDLAEQAGVEKAALYCEQVLAAHHPSLADAYLHAAKNIRAFALFSQFVHVAKRTD